MGKALQFFKFLKKRLRILKGLKVESRRTKRKKLNGFFFINIIGIIAKHLHVYISLNNKFSVQIMIVESFFSMSS